MAKRKGTDSSEQLIRDIFASVQDGISILGRDLTIVRVNDVMNRWYPDSVPLEGKRCYEAFHGTEYPCDPCPSIRCLETGGTEFDVVPGFPDSPVKWVELYSHPMKDPDTGEITGVVEFVRDITARMKIHEDLRLLADQSQATFDSMSDAVFHLDREARVVSCNQAALAFTGRTADQIIGMKCHEVVHCESDHIPECPFEKLMKSGKSEILLMSFDGNWFDSRIDPIRNPAGDIEGAVHVIRDITDIKTLERRQLFITRLFSYLPLSGNRRMVISHILSDIQEHTGMEAVGFRLAEGDDFPYYESIGFGPGIIESESILHGSSGAADKTVKGGSTHSLDCMCGAVLSCSADHTLDCITDTGSFWTNSLSDLLRDSPKNLRRHFTRDGCSREGYESVAFIPLRAGSEMMGLLQLSDHRRDLFTPEVIEFFEHISSALGVALARAMNEEKWRSVTKYSPDQIMLLDRDGTVRFVNHTVPALSVQEVLGRDVRDFVPPESARIISESIDRVLKTGLPDSYTAVYETSDGEKRYFDARIGPIWDEDRITGLVNTSSDVTDRKKMELALQQSEERLHLAVSGTAEGLWDCPDTSKNQEWWSPRYYELLGYEDGEIEANRETFFSMLHPDERDSVSDAIRGSIEGSDTFDIEYRLRLKSGDYRWYRSRARIMRDEAGNPVRVTGTLADVNDRKQAELALMESEASYRAIFDSVYDAVFVLDPETAEIIDVNDRASEFLHRTKDEILRMSAKDFNMGGSHHSQREVLRILRLTRSGEAQRVEWQMTMPDFEDCWVEIYFQSAVIAGEDRVLAVVRDITERKAIETEMLLKNIVFESSVAASSTAGVDGVIDHVNAAFLDIWGYKDKSEAIGKPISFFFMDPEDAVPVLNSLNETGIWKGEFLARRKDCSTFVAEGFATVMRNKQGELFGYQSALLDITAKKDAEIERKKLEMQVQRSQKLESIGVLAGGIAHDFNNILVSILGNADLALMDLVPEHPAYASVKDIERASRRASELIRQMLAYSGKGKIQIELVDLSRVIDEMPQMLRLLVSKKAVLRFDLADDLPPVEGDVTQIRQVLMNLVINASESLEKESGLITVRTSALTCDSEYLEETYLGDNLKDGVYCCIEVSDTGTGIDSGLRTQLFDPFFTTKQTGRGLGLAAVLGIVRAHKGSIKLYSEPGKGTTFRILLPASGSEASSRRKAQPDGKADEAWMGSGTVLLVDDEESVINVGKRMLERLGFSVLTAGNGRQALEVFRETGGRLRCVILDLTMPDLDGWETMRELLRIKEDVRVILCSGYSEQDISNHYVGTGFAGFIHKPFSSEELAAALKKTLES